MNSTVLEPNKLRPELIQRVEAMDDESLLLLHQVLLIVEKERLWRELSAEAEWDRRSGKFERLPEVSLSAFQRFAPCQSSNLRWVCGWREMSSIGCGTK